MREHGLAACLHFAPQSKAVASVTFSSWYQKLLELLFPDLPIGGGTDDPSINGLLKVRPIAPDRSTGVFYPHHVRTETFWQWMEHAGFALRFESAGMASTHDDPTRRRNRGDDNWIITERGRKRLDANHPCRPGAMQRLRDAFLTEHEESLNRLDDALTCLERGLPRPAVVLLGLAYEELIGVVLARLENKPVAQLKEKASERQDRLRKKVESFGASNAPEKDMRSKALLALNVADTIRDARNDAAHKAAGEWDAVHVEELVSSGVGAYHKLAGYKP